MQHCSIQTEATNSSCAEDIFKEVSDPTEPPADDHLFRRQRKNTSCHPQPKHVSSPANLVEPADSQLCIEEPLPTDAANEPAIAFEPDTQCTASNHQAVDRSRCDSPFTPLDTPKAKPCCTASSSESASTELNVTSAFVKPSQASPKHLEDRKLLLIRAIRGGGTSILS